MIHVPCRGSMRANLGDGLKLLGGEIGFGCVY
jgi:hypothetical protein